MGTPALRGQDFPGSSGRRCACHCQAARQSTATYRQNLSPDGSAVREHVFLCTGVFEGARPHNHFPGHSRRAMAGRAAQAGLAGSRGQPPGGDGQSASRRALRPDVRRRAHADGAKAAEHAGVCAKECGGIYRGGKSKGGLSAVVGTRRLQQAVAAVFRSDGSGSAIRNTGRSLLLR